MAGVFCGVLLQVSIHVFFFLLLIRVGKKNGRRGDAYGATGKSAFLFLMGSDMMNGE